MGLRSKPGSCCFVALIVLVPTVGDFGLTWDEPAYRYSQVFSAQWWEQLSKVRSWRDVHEVFDPLTLLYYWPYARHGINFHPPLAGQLNLAAHAVFGHWMKDIPSRRMASVIEFALTITIGFHFLARRYGAWVGLVAAGSLLLDAPTLRSSPPDRHRHAGPLDSGRRRPWHSGKGCTSRNGTAMAGRGRHLLGLAFIEKMGAVMVLLPLLLWLIVGYLPRSFDASWRATLRLDRRRVDNGRDAGPARSGLPADSDLAAAASPTGSYRPLRPSAGERLARSDPGCSARDLVCPPPSRLALPQEQGLGSRAASDSRPGRRSWRSHPLVGWLGNPAWWRETLPRLAHYYTLTSTAGSRCPNIQIMYFGQIYEFSLPWHNAWVLIGITVPGRDSGRQRHRALLDVSAQVRRDRLPFYFVDPLHRRCP